MRAVLFFPDGLYVIDAEGDLNRLIGARVVKFDNTPAEAAVRAIGRVVDRENDMEIRWRGPYHLAMPQVLHGLGITDSPDRVRLTVINRVGKTETVPLKPVRLQRRRKLFPSRRPDAPAPPLYLTKVEDAYWFEHLSADQTVYFQFNQVLDKPDESLPEFAQRLRRFLQEQRVRNLVVDLRHNNGGNTYRYPELLRTIIHFDAARADGNLFVLIGRNTFSAAQNFAVDLERLTGAIFIGEPTGGKPNTYGDESPTILPYSGLHVGLSAVYWQPSSPRDSRLWIAPKIPVPLSAEDYFANRDRALEVVIKLIRKGGEAVAKKGFDKVGLRGVYSG